MLIRDRSLPVISGFSPFAKIIDEAELRVWLPSP